MPEPTVYHFRVKYFIVDTFGDLLWHGTATITQDKPIPEGEAEQALHEALTAKTIRRTAPPEAPAGKVLIAAVFPM